MKKYKYVFSKELWKKDMNGRFYWMEWPQECDGAEVHFNGEDGTCLVDETNYTVFKRWCKKVKIKEKK